MRNCGIGGKSLIPAPGCAYRWRLIIAFKSYGLYRQYIKLTVQRVRTYTARIYSVLPRHSTVARSRDGCSVRLNLESYNHCYLRGPLGLGLTEIFQDQRFEELCTSDASWEHRSTRSVSLFTVKPLTPRGLICGMLWHAKSHNLVSQDGGGKPFEDTGIPFCDTLRKCNFIPVCDLYTKKSMK